MAIHTDPHFVTLYVENGRNSIRCRCGEELEGAASRLSVVELVEVAQKHLADTSKWVCEVSDELTRFVIDQLLDRGIEASLELEHEHIEPEPGEPAEILLRILVRSQSTPIELDASAIESRLQENLGELGIGTAPELRSYMQQAIGRIGRHSRILGWS